MEDADETIAVKVTVWPATDGLADELSTVWVETGPVLGKVDNVTAGLSVT